MATEVNQNYFAWSLEESSVQEISQGTSPVFGHGSISFGRFDLESLEWEKWSVFTNDRRHEEFGKFNGLVAKKKAYFEEYFKRIRELKALQQQNQQTELNLEYSGDGSDSSHTGEDEPVAENGAPTGSETLVDDSVELTTAATTFEHGMGCYDDPENGEISASAHSSSVGGSQHIGKQMRGNVSIRMDMSQESAKSNQDDLGTGHEIMMNPKRFVEKDSQVSRASKIIPDHTIVNKGSNSAKPSVINQMAKAKQENVQSLQRPIEASCDVVATAGRSGNVGFRRPSSSASQRPSTRERRPVNRDASRKPAEFTTACRPSTSERRLATRESAPKHANVANPHRPSTADRRPIAKESAPKQSNIGTPRRPSTADRRPITKESAPKQPNIGTPRRPSTADKRTITKESAPKQSNIVAARRPSTADRRPVTKESAPKQSNIAITHRPSAGETRPTARDMGMKHVGMATSCQPSTDKRPPVTRETAQKHGDVFTLRRPSTAERRPITRDNAQKHGDFVTQHQPSTAERRPVARDIAAKHAIVAPPCRPSTAERRPVTREAARKQANIASSCWPLTPDRRLTRENGISTPQRPSTGERRPITNDNTLKNPKTPTRYGATSTYSKGAMVTAVTPKRPVTPKLVKSSKLESISFLKERTELQVNGKQKSSSFNFPPRKMLTSNLTEDQVLENLRKPNKEEMVRAQAFAAPLQTGIVKKRAPNPPPPPPPPRRPSCTERKANVNNSPAGGRKLKPHLHTGTNPVSGLQSRIPENKIRSSFEVPKETELFNVI
ncbi:hypothetical protein ACP70R_035407 [Stipagrostis hirtigluma subsp. patula]